jgi:hypothetical protein
MPTLSTNIATPRENRSGNRFGHFGSRACPTIRRFVTAHLERKGSRGGLTFQLIGTVLEAFEGAITFYVPDSLGNSYAEILFLLGLYSPRVLNPVFYLSDFGIYRPDHRESFTFTTRIKPNDLSDRSLHNSMKPLFRNPVMGFGRLTAWRVGTGLRVSGNGHNVSIVRCLSSDWAIHGRG